MIPNVYIRLLDKLIPITGYPLGIGQPALCATLVAAAPIPPQGAGWAEIDTRFAELLGEPVEPELQPVESITTTSLAHAVLRWNCVIQRAAGWPTFSEGFSLPISDTPGSHTVMVPCLSGAHQEAALALGWVVEVMNLALAHLSLEPMRARLPKLLATMRAVGPQGMNTLRLLQAAYAVDIPWWRVQGNVYQFGWGSQARWLDSSFTDQTSRIGAVLARNKMDAANVLRRAGVPVPEHVRVSSVEEAIKAADRLGYPVVVKPIGLDGGAGVMPNLRNVDAVRRAYDSARKLTSAVMVEKHITGNDYRLQVFQSEVIWASHRIPGGVIGDGERTVTELLQALNADPKRGPRGSKALLKRVELDAEALELLTEHDLTPQSIPDNDRFVRLRRAANVASGGRPVPVLEQAHPDNLALALRAAQALRLDLAGVDLLIPDISRSWLETGAAVCEVNAQPQLWPTLPALILNRLVTGHGRIPTIAIVGVCPANDWINQLAQRFGELGKRVGIAGRDGASIAGTVIMRGPCEMLSAGQALLLNSDVDLAIVCLDDFRGSHYGLPFDRFDLMILAGGADGGNWDAWLSFVRALTSVCRGPVLANAAYPEWLALLDTSKRPIRSASLDDLAQIAVSELERLA